MQQLLYVLHQVDQQSSQLVEGWVGCPEEAKNICVPYLQQMDLQHARQQGDTAELGMRSSTVQKAAEWTIN